MSRKQIAVIVILGLFACLVMGIAGTLAFRTLSGPGAALPADPSPTPPPAPAATATEEASKIEVVSSRSTRTSDAYMTTEGQIKNVSQDILTFAEVVVEFYDDSGNFVTSDSGYAEFASIDPGQTSPFKIMTRYEPGMSHYELSFKYIPISPD